MFLCHKCGYRDLSDKEKTSCPICGTNIIVPKCALILFLSFVSYIVFDVMNKAKWHTFQVLTKRAERLEKIAPKLNWTPNIWLGVTVESNEQKKRIPYLINTPAHIKYLSIEPMITEIKDLSLDNINWVIVGGESGPGARPIQESWVTSIRDNCIENEIPFFFKQWGGVNKKIAGCTLQGRQWKELPV